MAGRCACVSEVSCSVSEWQANRVLQRSQTYIHRPPVLESQRGEVVFDSTRFSTATLISAPHKKTLSSYAIEGEGFDTATDASYLT